MGSAAVVRPPSKEFIRVYHLLPAEYGLIAIGLRRLKVARFSDLNDPFELMALNFRERRIRNIVRDFKNAYDAKTGLLCFSADWTSTVLWSHYAEKHRGICLGFNLLRECAETVLYEDQRIGAELEDSEPTRLDNDLQELLLCTKFHHWRYEEEVRRFVSLEQAVQEGNLYVYPFNQSLQLTEVILGPQCNLSLDEVRNLAKAVHTGVAVFKSRLAHKWFSVVPEESTVPPL